MYTIEHHGDEWEKYFRSRLLPQFPNYEEFWRRVIVPFTMRDVDGTIGFRPNLDKDLELLAMSHYTCYCHLGIAFEQLDTVAEKSYLYDDFFFHLSASMEMVEKRLLKYISKTWDRLHASTRGGSL